MKRQIFKLIFMGFFLLPLILSAQITQTEIDSALSGLPFDQFSISIPVFSTRQYNITDAGAVGDGLIDNTRIINATILKCSLAGGGTVVIPAGLWLTGPISMQSNVNLHLNEGAVVSFSSNLKDYPLIKSGSHYNITSLINGHHLENAAITGDGIFNGTGEAWRPVKKEKMNTDAWKKLLHSGGSLSADHKIWYPRKNAVSAMNFLKTHKASAMTLQDYQKAKAYYRPYMLNLENSKNILIEGITLQNSPKFCMIMRNITGLIVFRVKALNEWWAQNGDGLDVSACKNVLIDQCTVNTGDDGICMKSSSARENEFRLENVVIRDCKVNHAHGGFVIGSNTDGHIRNIYVTNCSFCGTDVGLRFKSNAGRGGMVTGIFVDGIYMKGIEKEAVLFDLTYEDTGAVKMKKGSIAQDKVPRFDGFSIRNIYVNGAAVACRMDGFPGCHVRNADFQNWVIKSKRGLQINYGENIRFNSLKLDVSNDSLAGQFFNVKQLLLQKIKLLSPEKPLKITGDKTYSVLLNSSGLNNSQFIISEEVNKKEIVLK